MLSQQIEDEIVMYYHYFDCAIPVSLTPTVCSSLLFHSIMQIEKVIQRHSSPRCFRGAINLKDFEMKSRFHRGKNQIFYENIKQKTICARTWRSIPFRTRLSSSWISWRSTRMSGWAARRSLARRTRWTTVKLLDKDR